MALIIGGFESVYGAASPYLIAVGFGMSTFGLAYFTVHDGFIHGRLPVAFLARVPAMRRVREAHLAHHRGGHRPPFGLFLGPAELRRYNSGEASRAMASRSR